MVVRHSPHPTAIQMAVQGGHRLSARPPWNFSLCYMSQASHLVATGLFVHPRLLPSDALLLTAPGPQDSAQFECVASNEVGEARRLYRVTVHGELGRRRIRKPGWDSASLSWVLSLPPGPLPSCASGATFSRKPSPIPSSPH